MDWSEVELKLLLTQVVRQELDLRLLKTEKLITELRADVRRHDNRFTSVDGRLAVLDDNDRAIRERLAAIEEALDVEAKETGGTLGERLARVEAQVAAINAKLKAG